MSLDSQRLLHHINESILNWKIQQRINRISYTTDDLTRAKTWSLHRFYVDNNNLCKGIYFQIPILGSQEGAFESVRLNFSGEQGQTLRQLINAHVLRHSAMCLIASANGKKQHLAVTHEKGKVGKLSSYLFKDSQVLNLFNLH